MKGKKFLLSCWLATAAFCLLQIVAGPNGVLVTAQLRSDLDKLDQRLVGLEADNARLQAQYDALRTSSEAVRLEARSLGWFSPGEVPVKVVEGASFALPGSGADFTMTVPALPTEVSDVFFRAAWFLFFAVFYASFSLIDLLRSKSSLPPSVISRGRLDFFRN